MTKKSKAMQRKIPPLEMQAARSRGPKPAFSRDKIAATAIKIADAEGIEAVSMRRIAAEMGSGTASLYRYITNKDELLDLMVDAMLPEFTLSKPSGDLRMDLRAIVSRGRKMILAHPWMISISTYRSSLGPNTLRWLELILGLLDGHGLDIDEMLVVSNTLFNFAKGYAAGEIAEQEASKRSGLSREQWMTSRAHHTQAILKTGKYPMFARVVKDARAPHDPYAAERGFYLGLDHILDGIELRISGGSLSRKRGAVIASPKKSSSRG